MAGKTPPTVRADEGEDEEDALYRTAMSRREDRRAEGLSCFPVLCGIPKTSCQTPAVKVTNEAGSAVYFPLAHDVLGEVWLSATAMLPWVEVRRETDWHQARRTFSDLVGYPCSFLAVLLQVFRSGRFHDGTLITSETWNTNALGDVEKIAVLLTCCKCAQATEVPVLLLHKLKGGKGRFKCKLAGARCSMRTLESSEDEGGPSESSEESRRSAAEGRRRRQRATKPVSAVWETWWKDKKEEESPNGKPERAPATSRPLWQTWRGQSEDAQSASPSRRDVAHPTGSYCPVPILPPPVRSSFNRVSAAHFILGQPAEQLHSPDPSSEEISECFDQQKSFAWRKLVTALNQWGSHRKDVDFEGEGDVKEVLPVD